MAYRFSIVSKAEDPQAPPDATIDATVQKLTPLTTVMRAASMEEVAVRIQDAVAASNGEQLSLQLVGHGVSGLLHLGSSWMGEPLPPKTFADPFYLLDTNPWSLGFLGEYRGKFEKVILAACLVGASDAEGYAINGRTLAYTLCELLRTTVIAATDFTDPEEFDAQGEYKPINHLLPCSWTWRQGREPLYDNPNGTTPIMLRLKAGAQGESFRIVGIRPRVPARHRDAVSANIEIRCREIDDDRLRHARPDLDLKLDGISEPASMLGNGRVLRIGERQFRVEEHELPARAISLRLSQRA